MKAEDFAGWLSAISGMSEGQCTEAIAALEEGERGRGRGGGSAKKARQEWWPPKSGRAGNDRSRARRGSGLSSLRGTRGRAVGAARTDFCGFAARAVGAPSCTRRPRTPYRRICARKRKWLDHARAMIEGKSLAKTAQLCGVHPTTAFRWRHRFLRAPAVHKPRSLSGIVEADETFVLGILQGADGPTPAAPCAQTRRQGQASGALSGQYSRSRRPRPEGRDLRRGPAPGRRGFHRKSACRRGHTGQPSDRRRRRTANRRLRPQSRDSVPRGARARKASPQAPHLHINTVNAYHGRLKQWLNRFNGVAAKNLPNLSLRWRRALPKPGASIFRTTKLDQKARSETDHTYS